MRSSILLTFALTCVLQIISVFSQFTCSGGTLYMVAHPDDELLFASPTLLGEVTSGLCVTTVIVTAGDAGYGFGYASGRETGSNAAYANMSGTSTAYTESYGTFGGQSVLIRTSTMSPQLQRLYLRLPDGNVGGGGFSATGYESLRSLYTGAISSISSIDGSATYTLATLRQAIADIVNNRRPSTIRTLDHTREYDTGDHSDHLTVARLTAEGRQAVGYMAYPVVNLPETVPIGTPQFAGKSNAFFAYANYDSVVCNSLPSCYGSSELEWLKREYSVGVSSGNNASANGGDGTTNPSGTSTASSANPSATDASAYGGNWARLANNIVASSQASNDQAASKAIDGVVDGYPGDYTKEWSTNGQGVGAWLYLTWSDAITVGSVVLYDRPNTNDWLQAGNITLDNGVIVPFSGVWNDGAAFTINLPQAYSTKTLRVTVGAVGPSTQNIGLAEIQVYSTGANTGGSTSTTSTSTGSSSASSTGTTSSSSSTGTSAQPSATAAVNLASSGTASASTYASEQSPDKAIDGTISGYKEDGSGFFWAEWASNGETTGAWWVLTWPSAVTISRVVLYDRPNMNDWITGATLSFSDGTSIPITSLDNAGAATTFDFPSRSVTSMRLTVTSVGSATKNIGLSEVQVYNIAGASSLASSSSTSSKSSSSTSSSSSSTTPPSSSSTTTTSRSSTATTTSRSSTTTTSRSSTTTSSTSSTTTTSRSSTTTTSISSTTTTSNSSTTTTSRSSTTTTSSRSSTTTTGSATTTSPSSTTTTSATSSSSTTTSPSATTTSPSTTSSSSTTTTTTSSSSSTTTSPSSTGTATTTSSSSTSTTTSSSSSTTSSPSSSSTTTTSPSATTTSPSATTTSPSATTTSPSTTSSSSTTTSSSSTTASSSSTTTTTSSSSTTTASSSSSTTTTASPTSSPSNLARAATASASSESPDQGANKAIDGVISGWPADYTKEWASNGQKTGATITLTWTTSTQMNRVILYDRPNTNDQVTGGTLTFSDGSTVSVPSLNNAGTATTINFTARSVKSVKLTITSVSSTTQNIGLAEFEVYNV